VVENLLEEFKVKAADELVTLVNQREHIKILKGKCMAIKLILKWVYDPDVERLSELQAREIQMDKEYYKIESNYKQTLQHMQQLQ
jgi:hypothetical protein